jgi:integrase
VLFALYTGQRREDLVAMTWQQFQGDLIRVNTSKTRELLEIPCHPILRAHLEALRKSGQGGAAERARSAVPTRACRYATANALSGALQARGRARRADAQ